MSVVTYNCHGLTSSLHDIKQLRNMHHIIFPQETWLAKQTLDQLTDISDNHFACGTAKVDCTKGIAADRPYCGAAILWNNQRNCVIDSQSVIDWRYVKHFCYQTVSLPRYPLLPHGFGGKLKSQKVDNC